MRSVYILITGKVHGVFYRASAKQKADELQIRGWVKNSKNGVEIKAVGSADAMADFIEWCHTGPERARVDDVIVKDIPKENFNDFSIKR